MFERPTANGDDLVRTADALHAEACAAQRRLLRVIADIDRTGAWRNLGARDHPHWLSMRFGISWWKADRWVKAARALEHLPAISIALAEGELGVDKVLELCRFARPETETALLRWAREVSPATVRRRADAETRITAEENREMDRARSLHYWEEDDGRCLGLEAHLPAAQGAVVVKAIERMTERLPRDPLEPEPIDSRRADALVALCSAAVGADPDPDRATIVVHAPAAALAGLAPPIVAGPARVAAIAGAGNGELESGGVVAPATLARLACDARIQVALEWEREDVVSLGPVRREPSASQLRQLRYRDRGCRFPGCGTRAFTHAHHIRWWSRGGSTDLSNLVLVCSFHHRLVHEHGWSLARDADGQLRWRTRDGESYRRRRDALDVEAVDPAFLDTG